MLGSDDEMTSIDNTPFKTPFTKNIHSPSIGHVLYTYTNINEYLINATSFIAEGLGHHHTILYMDRLEFFEQIKSKLEDIGYSKNNFMELIL